MMSGNRWFHYNAKQEIEEKTDINEINEMGEFDDSIVIKEEISDEYIENSSNFNILPDFTVKEEEPIDIYDDKIYVGDINENEEIDSLNDNYENGDYEYAAHNDQCDYVVTSNTEQVPRKNNQVKSKIENPCKYCFKVFKLKCHANRHMYYECALSKERKSAVVCTICRKNFTSKSSFKRHNLHIHKQGVELNVMSCRFCRKSFITPGLFNRHVRRSCVVNEYKCKSCNRKYRDSASLVRHTKHECGKIPRFGCAHCDYLTLQKINLVRHLQRRHEIPFPLRKIACPKCRRAYKNGATLARHLKYECGKEPMFACKLCPYKAKRKSCLASHVQNKHVKKERR